MSRRRLFLLFGAIVGWFGRDGTRATAIPGTDLTVADFSPPALWANHPEKFPNLFGNVVNRSVWLNYQRSAK